MIVNHCINSLRCRNDVDAASNDILADITEWSDGKRFIAPDADDIGHINDALREVLRFEAALPSSQTPVVVSL